MLERCGATKTTNATKASTYSTVNKPQRLDQAPLSGGLEGGNQNFYTKHGATPQLNLGLPTCPRSSYNSKTSSKDNLFHLGHGSTPKSSNIHKGWWGNQVSLVGNVDLDLLHQIFKFEGI
jgi:hypothetical protein